MSVLPGKGAGSPAEFVGDGGVASADHSILPRVDAPKRCARRIHPRDFLVVEVVMLSEAMDVAGRLD